MKLSSVFNNLADMGMHAAYTRAALQQLRTIERDRGSLALGTRRSALAYSRDVFGTVLYAPWFWLYSAVYGRFVEGWIPESFYALAVAPRVNRPRDAAGAKSLAGRILPARLLPDLAYAANGVFFDTAGTLLSGSRLSVALFSDSDTVIAKPEQSGGGRGIEMVTRDTFDPIKYVQSGRRVVFQRYLHQHETFDTYADAGTTIRITTATDPHGSVGIRAAYARLAPRGETIVRSRTAYRVPINSVTGRATDGSLTSDWRRADSHPVSGAEFSALLVPQFAEAGTAVCDIHQRLPHFGCIGWDVMIDRNGAIWLLEWNALRNSIAFSEAAGGPRFRGLNWERYARGRRKPRD